MGLYLLLDQLLNFFAPALVVGFLLALAARLLGLRGDGRHSWLWHGCLNAFAGACVLVGALLYFGHDGKMASYAALVGVAATTQFVGARSWRR